MDIQRELEKLRVSYRETGKDFSISCPFHEDKTPSLKIDKQSGVWHCFSCGRKGRGLKSLFGYAYEDEENIPQITISEAVKDKYYNKQVKVRAMISSKDIVPKEVAKKILFTCDGFEDINDPQEYLDRLDPKLHEKYKDSAYVKAVEKKAVKIVEKNQKLAEKCQRCILRKHEKEWGCADISYHDKPETFLSLYYASLDKEPAVLKKYFGVGCDRFNYKVVETQNIIRVLVQPDLLYTKELGGNTNFLVEAFSFNTDLSNSQAYEFTVRCIRNPINQNVSFIITEAEERQTNTIKIIENDVELLKEFFVC